MLLWGALTLAATSPVLAHHSFAKFDASRSIEIDGEVTAVRWQNPHIGFTVRAEGAGGRVEVWTRSRSPSRSA